MAAGVILTDYLLLGAVCAEVHFYLGKDGGEVLAAVSLEEGELKQLVVDGHWSEELGVRNAAGIASGSSAVSGAGADFKES